MRAPKTLRGLFACLVFAVTLPAAAIAAQISVEDGAGKSGRATADIQEPATLKFVVMDAAGQPASNTVVTLSNEAGQTMTAAVVNGSAVLENVPAGVWKFTLPQGFSMLRVEILAAGGKLSAMLLGSTVAALGGATAIVASSDSGGNQPISPFE